MEQSNTDMGKQLTPTIKYLIETNTEGTIGLEAASSYWGLSTFSPDIPIIMVNFPSKEETGYYCELGYIKMFFASNLNTDNIIKLSETLSITDREQTVCDMIRYDRHEFHLFETVLNAYEDKEVNIDKLEKLAKSYGILERLHAILKEALAELDEE